MRYSSHPPRAFRNRIARHLGVLVAAALVAALGLPSAVQAQTTDAPVVKLRRRHGCLHGVTASRDHRSRALEKPVPTHTGFSKSMGQSLCRTR